MAVCDANYIRILKLFPDFSLAAHRAFALPVVGADRQPDITHIVMIEVTERFKYTSTVSISMHLTGAGSTFYRPPAMLVRLYHDATTAEVVSYQNERYIRVLYQEDEVPRFYPDEKEQINEFLAEWLTLCLDAGLGQTAFVHKPRPAPGLIPSA